MVLFFSTAYGEEPATDWNFELAPLYLWAISVDGTETVKGREVDVDTGFIDILDNLNVVVTFHFDVVWKEQWGGFVDFIYLGQEGDGTSLPGKTVTPEFTQNLSEIAGFYRIDKKVYNFDFFWRPSLFINGCHIEFWRSCT